MVSSFTLIFKSSTPFADSLKIDSSAPITIGITVNFMVHVLGVNID